MCVKALGTSAVNKNSLNILNLIFLRVIPSLLIVIFISACGNQSAEDEELPTNKAP